MHIRIAEPNDLPEIVNIYNAAIPARQSTADLEAVSVESRQAWFTDRQMSKHPIWVATITDMNQGDVIIGWLSLQPFYDRSGYDKTAEISIYIRPNYQGQGVGRKLLQHLIEAAPTLDIDVLIGWIFAHNAPSLKLFQSLGFTQWGLLPQVADLEGKRCDLVAMGLLLPKLEWEVKVD
ncbi:MAG: N-acetyltransferase family protein [Pseudanabaena sp. ELA607]|jgi:phosphinothricin acetyltransferase